MFKLCFSVCFLSIFVWHVYVQPRSQMGPIYLDSMELRLDTMQILMAAARTRLSRLHVELAVNSQFLKTGNGLQPCTKSPGDENHCVEYDRTVRLEIQHRKRSRDRCYTITWTPLSHDFIPQDCLVLKGARWFGGSVSEGQIWPLNERQVRTHPYASGYDSGYMLERYWLSSSGIGVFVHDEVPLHMNWNALGNGGFCLKASYEGSAYQHTNGQLPVLKYTICEDSDLVRVHKHMFAAKYKKPEMFPITDLIQNPTWYVGLNKSVSDADIVQYVKDMRKHGFANGYVDIGTISKLPGDISVTTHDDINNLINTLHKLEVKVFASVTIFINSKSPFFLEGLEQGAFLKDSTGQVPSLTTYNGEVGALIDVTDSNAAAWYRNILQTLQKETGVDAWRFEPVHQAPFDKVKPIAELSNAGGISNEVVALASTLGEDSIVEEGCRSQEHPVYSTFMQHQSSWDAIKTIIPQMLQRNLLGYPLTLPGPIGGTSENGSELPGKELFIRWMELCAYLPAMQFSTGPWQYDADTVKLTRNYMKRHQTEVMPHIQQAMQDYLQNGSPVIRPLWWHHPHDRDSLTIDSEFLIGDSLLVAPILDDGSRSRDIYLPHGKWQDKLNGGVIQGRTWVKNYRIKLSEIATFELVKEPSGKL